MDQVPTSHDLEILQSLDASAVVAFTRDGVRYITTHAVKDALPAALRTAADHLDVVLFRQSLSSTDFPEGI